MSNILPTFFQKSKNIYPFIWMPHLTWWWHPKGVQCWQMAIFTYDLARRILTVPKWRVHMHHAKLIVFLHSLSSYWNQIYIVCHPIKTEVTGFMLSIKLSMNNNLAKLGPLEWDVMHLNPCIFYTIDVQLLWFVTINSYIHWHFEDCCFGMIPRTFLNWAISSTKCS